MKKTISVPAIAVIIIIGIIIAVIFVKNKTGNKYNYEIEEIAEYKYYVYKENDNFGVIDKNGNTVIEAKYKDVIIPNPRKKCIYML